MYISSTVIGIIIIIAIAIYIFYYQKREEEKNAQKSRETSIKSQEQKKHNDAVAMIEKKQAIHEIMMVFNCNEEKAITKYQILSIGNSLIEFQEEISIENKITIFNETEKFFYYAQDTLIPICKENELNLSIDSLFEFKQDIIEKKDICILDKLKQLHYYNNNSINGHRISTNEMVLLNTISNTLKAEIAEVFCLIPELKWELTDVQIAINAICKNFNIETDISIDTFDYRFLFLGNITYSIIDLNKIFSYVLYESKLFELNINFYNWEIICDRLFFSPISYDINNYIQVLQTHISEYCNKNAI